MSLTQINDYGIGNVNLTSLMETLDRQRRGYQALSLTHYDDTLEPKIAAGSIIEVGGALFKTEADESITGWAGIGNSNDVYIRLAPAGQIATAFFGLVTPTWSTSKQGWYYNNDRYIGGLYKDAGGNYTDKWLYAGNNDKTVPLDKIVPGVLNTYLKAQGVGASPIYGKVALADTGIDMDQGAKTGAGTLIVSGVGFQPSVVIFLGTKQTGDNQAASWGFDDGTRHYCVYKDYLGNMYPNTAKSINIKTASGDTHSALITTMGTDGFTLTWYEVGVSQSSGFVFLALP